MNDISKRKLQNLESKLSKFNSMVSLANDDIEKAKECAVNAACKLVCIQQEIENLYIMLDEPPLIAVNGAKAGKPRERVDKET